MTLAEGYYPINDPVYLTSDYDHPKEIFKSLTNIIESKYHQSPLSLVDVGCASGAFLHYAMSRLNLTKCAGVDVSDKQLIQARQVMPHVEFICHSIDIPQQSHNNAFDVCTFIGTMSLFDEIDTILNNLLSYLKPGGSLFVVDLINDDDIDLVMRYRAGGGKWQAGFNVRSRKTYESALNQLHPGVEITWTPFEMPFEMPKTSPLRVWTTQTEQKKYQQVVGTGQLINFEIMKARLLS